MNGSDQNLLEGQVIDGRWRIEKKIGEGGMGSVYLGRQVNIDRPVAIKTLRREIGASDEFVRRFELEARAAGRISNPHCVTIFESGKSEELGGLLYLVMEYLNGESLGARVERGRMNPRDAIKVAIEIASGLAAAHDEGIVHRDLKPDNVFLVSTPGGEFHAKVLDFGIAKAMGEDAKLTQSGVIIGTPYYMSPEQCTAQEVDERTDLYALGTILYEMLSGRTPFISPTPIAVLVEVVNKTPPTLLELGVPISPELNAFVMRLLSKEPDERPVSAMEVKRTLEMLNDRSDALGQALADTMIASSPNASLPTQVRRQPKKGWVVALLVAVLSVGVLAALVWTQRADVPADSPAPVLDSVVLEREESIDPVTVLEASTKVGNAMIAAQSEHLDLARKSLERSKSRPKRPEVAPKTSKAKTTPTSLESPKSEPSERAEKTEPADKPLSEIEKYRREQAERLKREGEKAKESIKKDVRDKIRERMRDFKY